MIHEVSKLESGADKAIPMISASDPVDFEPFGRRYLRSVGKEDYDIKLARGKSEVQCTLNSEANGGLVVHLTMFYRRKLSSCIKMRTVLRRNCSQWGTLSFIAEGIHNNLFDSCRWISKSLMYVHVNVPTRYIVIIQLELLLRSFGTHLSVIRTLFTIVFALWVSTRCPFY